MVSATSPQSETSEAPRARVLAGGHLHPGMLFLRFFDGIRQSIVPGLIAIFVVDQGHFILPLAAVFLVLGMVLSIVRFLTFRYELTADELVTREGVLRRQERRIPVDRIQDLNFESSPLRRVFGLVVVTVETASGQGSEAQLDSLSQADARILRHTLYRLRGKVDGGSQSAERPLHRVRAEEIALLGLSDNRLGAILLFGLGVFEFGESFGFGEELERTFGGVFRGMAGVDSVFGVLLGLAVAFVLLVGGWVLSVAGAFALYHDFRLVERDGVLVRRFGLFTRRSRTLPRHKIQRLLLEAPPMRRVIGMVSMRADSAGSAVDAEDGGGRDVVVPLAPAARVHQLVPWLLRGASLDERDWQRVSPKVVIRTSIRFAILALILALPAHEVLGTGALALILLPITGFGIGVATLRNAAYARDRGHVYFRWGVLGRFHAVIPLRKVQCALARAGAFERIAGLSRVTVFVAGAGPTTLPNLPRREAEELIRWVTRVASERKFDG